MQNKIYKHLPDYRPLEERYDFYALHKALVQHQVMVADDMQGWFASAKAYCQVGLGFDEYKELSQLSSKYKERENVSLFRWARRHSDTSKHTGAKYLLHVAKQYLNGTQQFYIPQDRWHRNSVRSLLPPKPLPTAPARSGTSATHRPIALPTLGPIGQQLVQQCMRGARNSFSSALMAQGWLTPEQMADATVRFKLGSTKRDEVVYWLIDEQGQVRDGKLMAYGADGHRRKDPGCHVLWVSYLLRRMRYSPLKLPEGWEHKLCLFGLHQLADVPADAPVAIVEAEKTAVICTELLPQQGYVWMATGGLNNFTVPMLRVLRGRRVMVFPDTDSTGQTFGQWLRVCLLLRSVLKMDVHISTVLEHHASAEQKARKIDIADFLLEGRMEQVKKKEEDK